MGVLDDGPVIAIPEMTATAEPEDDQTSGDETGWAPLFDPRMPGSPSSGRSSPAGGSPSSGRDGGREEPLEPQEGAIGGGTVGDEEAAQWTAALIEWGREIDADGEPGDMGAGARGRIVAEAEAQQLIAEAVSEAVIEEQMELMSTLVDEAAAATQAEEQALAVAEQVQNQEQVQAGQAQAQEQEMLPLVPEPESELPVAEPQPVAGAGGVEAEAGTDAAAAS